MRAVDQDCGWLGCLAEGGNREGGEMGRIEAGQTEAWWAAQAKEGASSSGAETEERRGAVESLRWARRHVGHGACRPERPRRMPRKSGEHLELRRPGLEVGFEATDESL